MASRSAATAAKLGFADLFGTDDQPSSAQPIPVPDIIEFALSPQYLNIQLLYPRQATLLKVIFLQLETFTEYDYSVLKEWTSNGFKLDPTKITEDAVLVYEGDWGIQPDVLDRIQYLRDNGYLWFQIILAVQGRRSGKGFIGAICAAYVLWHFICLANPHKPFGVDGAKRLACQVFAGKKGQARDNQWKDIANVINNAPCFAPYLSTSLAESMTVFAPLDLIKAVHSFNLLGKKSEMDSATFEIVPKEASTMAARGPASFMQFYDEGAHMVATGPSRSMREVWDSATPALDQFKKWGFIYSGSSPWAMVGKFYELCQQALTVEAEPDAAGRYAPVYPENLIVQLESWSIYLDHEMTLAGDFVAAPERLWIDRSKGKDDQGNWNHKGVQRPAIFLKPLIAGAISEFDTRMQRLERANPQTFAVERRSKWAVATDSYLDQFHVRRMFQPWPDEEFLHMTRSGPQTISYVMHGDPGKTSSNFGFCVAHSVPDPAGSPIPHVIIDYVNGWRATDFPNSYSQDGAIDNEMDYMAIETEITHLMDGFLPFSVSFDQYASMGMMQRLGSANRQHVKVAQVWERTATASLNWQTAEVFKMALGMNRIHSPYYDLLELECLFLRKLAGDKIDHPDSGPCTTKDVYDAVSACVHQLLGAEISAAYGADFSALRMGVAMPGILTPDHLLGQSLSNRGEHSAFSAFSANRRPTNRG